ncbi:MAG: NlpC/P60 family protein [Terrimesophilobacter sp.]
MSSKSMHRSIAKLTVIAVSGGLVATLALPAYAFSTQNVQPEASTSQRSELPTQTLASGPSIDLAVTRDGYSATKPAPVMVRATASATVNRFVTLNPPAPSYSGSAVVAYGMQFVGVVPYGYGNSPTTSFSCDGFTQYVFAAFGISLPRTADAQARLAVRISPADAVPGDLLWWPGQHIGIYAGPGQLLDSPRPGRYVELHAIWGNPVYLRLTK